MVCLLQVFKVDEALTEAEQFVWGGDKAAQAAELTASLRRVRRWASRVSAATKTKPTMDLLRQLLAADPPPMQHPGASPPCVLYSHWHVRSYLLSKLLWHMHGQIF